MDLRGNPTLNRMQVDKAFEKLRSERPGLSKAFGQTPVDIRLGNIRGPGFGETFQPGEQGPPGQPAPGNPDNLRIELRKSRMGGIDEKKDFLIGELLHQMGGITQDGKPFNKKFMDLKEELVRSLTPDQMREEKFFFDQAINGGATGSNFQDFASYLMTTRGDALIRGDVLPQGLTNPKERGYYERRDGTGQFNKDQIGILDKIRAIIDGT